MKNVNIKVQNDNVKFKVKRDSSPFAKATEDTSEYLRMTFWNHFDILNCNFTF